MKALSLLTALSFVLLSSNSFADTYSCSIVKRTTSGTKVMGQFDVTPATSKLNTVILNDAKDFAACGGSPGDDNGKPGLMCVFAKGNSEIKRVRPLIGNTPSFVQKNRVTGEITLAPIAVTNDGAAELDLVLRVGDSIYGAICKNAALRVRR